MNHIERFLIDHTLHESCFDFDEHVEAIISEMEKGLSGADSSLLMLPSYLGIMPIMPPEGEAVAVDAGGTNLRIALVHFEPGAAPAVRRHERYRLPGSDGAIEKDEFFTLIAEYICGIAETAGSLGFCFSFPCEIGADRDGRIIGFNKEVKILDSEGAMLGVELNAAFARAGREPLAVTVLNDTVAALVGGVFAKEAFDMGGHIGLIYGTGMNICYYDGEKHMLINTEMGGYDGFRQSVCDAEIDKESDRPGDHRFEKMVSGAYFASVALKAVRLAAGEKLFSDPACKAIDALNKLDAASIDGYMQGSGGLNGELGRLCMAAGDAEALYGIFDGLYDRAAKLLAIAVTATLKKCGVTAQRPALIVAEGSMFSKGFRFRERFENCIVAYADGEKAYELELADGYSIIGAAASVFL